MFNYLIGGIWFLAVPILIICENYTAAFAYSIVALFYICRGAGKSKN